MIEKILFSLISFLLFAYLFIFKLIKKNDTTYLVILISQAIGIMLNFVQIIFNMYTIMALNIINYLLCLIIPAIVLILESRGINFSELIHVSLAKILLILGKRKKAKDLLFVLVSKYDKSYNGHKMLAEIYEKEGGMRKAIDEYVKVLDIKGNDYNSYFKISKLLKELGRKEEAIQMLNILIKKKPELYDAVQSLRRTIIRTRKI